MNETEIRNRLRDAVGDADYPPGLAGKVVARLSEPPSPAHPRLVGVIAAVLAVFIVVSLVYVRLHSTQPTRPATNPSPAATATPQVVLPPQRMLPDADLAAAQLTAAAAVVTPFHAVSTGGRTVTLMGGYADPSRIVLVFRTLPDAGSPQLQVSDDEGSINAGYFGARGSAGDQIVSFQQGPHVATGKVAHLTITITGFAQSSATPGTWSFSAALPVQSANALPLTPNLTSVGTWKVTVEAFELTPSVVHLRALVYGTAPSGVTNSTAALVAADGTPIKPLTIDATVAGSNQTRLDETWARPAGAASDQLEVNGGGGHYSANVSIPAPPTFGDNGKPGKGQPVTPLSFPEATESLDFGGALNDHIASGHPQSCGSATGPSGRIYAFATYFQSDGAWYYVTFYTDPAAQQYHGLGTYPVRASLSPISIVGSTEPMFTGTAQLTVTSEGGNQFGGLQNGSVSGSLSWTDDPQQKLNISGTWTCRFSLELGPA
jgi:hypothetical protein